MSEANHERALLQRLAAGPVGGDVLARELHDFLHRPKPDAS